MFNILSLFDGISCGQVALRSLGVPIKNYFASEIDRNAIAVTQHNHPDTIQLGDIKTLKLDSLPKIDLLLAGFPCQDFSFAGRQAGLKGDRGSLFFDLIRIKEVIKPKYFLFENVQMSANNLIQISKLVGCPSQAINSALFSAQARLRLYWTNLLFGFPSITSSLLIKNILNPTHQPVALKVNRLFIDCPSKSREGIEYLGGYLSPREKTFSGFRRDQRVVGVHGKYPTILASYNNPWIMVGGDSIRRPDIIELERLQGLPDGYTSSLPKSLAMKAVGNGWQVDTVKCLLQSIKFRINT